MDLLAVEVLNILKNQKEQYKETNSNREKLFLRGKIAALQQVLILIQDSMEGEEE